MDDAIGFQPEEGVRFDHSALIKLLLKNTMPFPKINPNEMQEEFVQRCMADDTMMQEYPNEQQRLAICYLQGKNGKKQEQNRNAQKSTGTHKKNAV